MISPAMESKGSAPILNVTTSQACSRGLRSGDGKTLGPVNASALARLDRLRNSFKPTEEIVICGLSPFCTILEGPPSFFRHWD